MTNKPSFAEELAELSDIRQPLRYAQLKVLAGIAWDDLRLLRKEWPFIAEERRIQIVQALNAMAEDTVEYDFSDVLHVCLSDPEPEVRIAAIDGLWEDERTSTLNQLIDLAADRNQEVRSSAVISLARFAFKAELGELSDEASARLHAILLTTATNPEEALNVRRRAIEALGYFANSSEAQAEVGRAYAHPEQLMRESAIMAMGRSMRPTWFPYIERELRSPSPAMRYEAARALGEIGEDARPMLRSLLPLVEDEDLEIATSAIWALGQIGGPQAKRVLERLARSKQDALRQAADEALEELALSEE